MVVRDAYENARFLCDQYYLASPELEVIEHNGEFFLISYLRFIYSLTDLENVVLPQIWFFTIFEFSH